jgi:deoxyribose-phosphate aldolase
VLKDAVTIVEVGANRIGASGAITIINGTVSNADY